MIVCGAVLCACSPTDGVSHAAASTATPVRDLPAPVEATALPSVPLLEIPRDEWREVVGKLCGRGRHGKIWMKRQSSLLHFMRLRHAAVLEGCDDCEPTEELLSVFADDGKAQAVLGRSLLLRTRYGVRFRDVPAVPQMRIASSASHKDQAISQLLEIGAPLSLPLDIGGQKFSLADVLEDVVAQWDTNAKEVEWSTITVALALPPRRSWVNKHGETCTFDQLAERVVAVPLHELSCEGTHMLYAMIVLLEADRQHHVLSSGPARILRVRIEQLLGDVIRGQRSDGSWASDWHRREERGVADESAVTRAEKVLVTSHLGECLLRSRLSVPGSSGALGAAAAFLWKSLREDVAALAVDDATLDTNVCPITHSLVVVKGAMRCP